jgi:hypothetical protein
MIPFNLLNEKYYDKIIQSYTSDDEYNANKRVWENNELPATDPYDLAHSMLHDDLWKWMLGYTGVAFDIPLSYETNEDEYFDDDGVITQATIAKYVNGVRAKNYGPRPTYHYERDKKYNDGGMNELERQLALRDNLTQGVPDTNSYVDGNGKPLSSNQFPMVYRPIWPEGTRYEVNGTIAPEYDFLLHEGYRYLKTLYPNHPDYIKILTTNEINDEFNQAATFINFAIDCPFYDWLATQLDYNSNINEIDLYQLYRKEALKLKFKNLTKHAFRRKLYGSKIGYTMFGSEIFQHVSIYPVAEYLPLIPPRKDEMPAYVNNGTLVTAEEATKEYYNIDGTNNFKWYRKLFDTPELFRERRVNYEDTLYTHAYRLIDFSHKSYEFPQRYEPPVKIYGTAYPSPLSPYDLYEYPAERDLYIPLTMQDDFYEGEKVWIGDFNKPQDQKTPSYINSMYYEDAYRVPISLVYNENSQLESGSILLPVILEKKISKIQVTSPVYPIYEEFYIYRGIKDSLQWILDYNADHLNSPISLTGFNSASSNLLKEIKALYRDTNKPPLPEEFSKIGNIAIDIFQEGNIYLPAQQFLSLYREDLKIEVNRYNLDSPVIEYFGTSIDTDGYIRAGDLLYKEASLVTNGVPNASGLQAFVSEICGINGGELNIIVSKPYLFPLSVKQEIEKINNNKFAEYGIVLQFSQNNKDSFGKKVVIFGKPEFNIIGPDYNNLYSIDKITFTIASIPKIKSNSLLRLVYSDFHISAVQKAKDLFTVFGEGKGLSEDNFYKKYYANEIIKINENYTEFKTLINSINPKFENIAKTRKNVNLYLNELIEFFDYKDWIDPNNKFDTLNNIKTSYDSDLDTALIVNPDITAFNNLNNTLINSMQNYKNNFVEDLDARFPIQPSYDGLHVQVAIIKEFAQSIQDIIAQIGEFTEDINAEKLAIEYNKFYDYFEEFKVFFEYSNAPNGLYNSLIKLLPPFKGYADDEIFAISCQQTIRDIHYILNEAPFGDNKDYNNHTGGIKGEVNWIYGIIDKGGKEPYKILNAKNYLDLKDKVDEFKQIFIDNNRYSEKLGSLLQKVFYDVYNVVVSLNAKEIVKASDALYNQIEQFRKPYIQFNPDYSNYLDDVLSEIDKYYQTFKDELCDLPIVNQNDPLRNPVRFPIESTIRKLLKSLEDFTKSVNDEKEYWLNTVSYIDSMLNYYRYENDIRMFHYYNEEMEDDCNELKRQLSIVYSTFRTTVDKLSITDADFYSYRTKIINDLHGYNTFYNESLCCVIATDLNRDYYLTVKVDSFTAEQKSKLENIKYFDKKVDSYLPNRGLLLKPLPKDIYLNSLDENEESSYSLLPNQDTYLGIFGFNFDSFNTFIEHNFIKEFARQGTITGFNPGTVNTAQVVNADAEILDVAKECYSSNLEDNTDNYIRNYTLDGIPYRTLNEDILDVNSLQTGKKFSYCEGVWLELFLPENKKKNIEGELPVRHEVEIRSIITKDSKTISFIDEESKNRIYSLTTGDQVIGPNIEDDTLIEAIDLFNFQITVNKPINVSGDYVLTYMTRYNLYPEEFDSSNFHDYRVNLSHSGKRDRSSEPTLVDNGSILEHGIYGTSEYPYTSQYQILGHIDISKYQEDLLHNLKTYPAYSTKFEEMVVDSHGYKGTTGASHYYAMPSLINYYGAAYLEVNAYKLYKKDNGEEYLMVTDILDYFQNYLNELSRASDKVNVGVNIIATTDSSGNVSPLGYDYSDPGIKLRFVTTTDWSASSVPAYVELGTGCLEDLFGGHKVIEPQIATAQDKAYYNYDVYDSHDVSDKGPVPLASDESYITLDQLAEQGITLDRDSGGLYSSLDNTTNINGPSNSFEHVDIPVLTYNIGEYEVQRSIKFENYFDPNKLFTTIQFSLIKQQFDIEITGAPLKQVTNNFLSLKIFYNIPTNYYTFTTVDDLTADLILPEDLITPNYRGEWVPNTVLKNGRLEIDLPSPEIGLDLYYYSIPQTKTLMNCYDPQTNQYGNFEFKFGTILLWEDNKWVVKTFIFDGIVGSSSYIINNLLLENKEEVDISIGGIVSPNENITLTQAIIFKILTNARVMGFPTDPEAIPVLKDYFATIYEWICDARTDIKIDSTDFSAAAKNLLRPITSYKSGYDTATSKYASRDEIHWLFISGYSKTGNDSQSNIARAFANIKEDPLAFALVFTKGKFYIYILNHSRMFYMINHSRFTNSNGDSPMTDQEWTTFLGKYGATANHIFPWEKILEYQNTLQLPYSNLVEGSVTFNWKLFPHFTVNGNPYNDDGTISKEVKQYDITEGNIYYDEINNNLYSTNKGTGNSDIKFKIIQENNRYFKNLMYLYCNYDTEFITEGTNLLERVKLTAIPGVTFYSSALSVKDRILQIEQINIRSPFNLNLESTQFSNYLKLTGIIKGVHIDGNNKYLSIGYRDTTEPKLTANRLVYSSEVNKIRPMRYNATSLKNESYPYSTIDFSDAKWPDGSVIQTPQIQHSEVYEDLVLDADLTVFKYYKNTLILEGKVDIADPGLIDFTDNPKLGNALSKITTGNKIISIVGLNSLQSKSYNLFKVLQNTTNNPASTINIEFLDFNNGFLVGVDERGFFAYASTDINNLGIRRNNEDWYTIIASHFTYANVGATGTYARVVSLTYDEDNYRWIISLSRNSSSEVSTDSGCDMYELTLTQNEGVIYPTMKLVYSDKAGMDINTYQKITIKDEDFNDPRYDSYADVFARDIAFEYIPEKTELVDKVYIVEPISSGNSVSLNESTISGASPINDSTIDGITRKKGFRLRSSGPITTINVATEDYKILSFLLRKSSNDSSSISLGISYSGKDLTERVDSIWSYNYGTGMWEKTSNMSAFSNFITDFDHSNQCIPVTVYIVNKNYLYNENNSEFKLRDLPLPQINTVAIVVRSAQGAGTDYACTIKATINGSGNYDFFDLQIVTPRKFLNKKYVEGYIENAYNPIASYPYGLYNSFNILQKNAKFYSDKWSAYHGDYQAVLMGSSLFIKSPTRTVISTGGGNKPYDYGTTYTVRYHWKRAELPLVSDITYSLFKEMSIVDAYYFVKTQFDELLPTIKQLANSSTTGSEEKAVYQKLVSFFSLNNDQGPKKYLTEEELPVSITENQVTFVACEYGKIPCFDSTKFEEWQSTQDAKYELGDVIDVYLKTQNYLRYLADYYAVILGVKRFDFMFEPGSIKDFSITDKQLIIQTKYNDILTLDSAFWGSRKEIEDYNNWSISNIDSRYVFPSNSGKVDRAIGYKESNGNIKYVTVGAMDIIFPDKAFTLLNKYIEGNISIYCGYIKSNQYVNSYYSSLKTLLDTEKNKAVPDTNKLTQYAASIDTLYTLFPNNSGTIGSAGYASIFEKAYPVIFISTDGKNFSKVNIPTAQSWMKDILIYNDTESNYEAFSIVREGTEIKVYFRQNGTTTPLGYTTLNVGTYGANITLTSAGDLVNYVAGNSNQQKTVTEARNGFLNSLNSIITGSVTPSGPSTFNEFMINQQYRPDISDAEISEILDSSIRYTPAPVESSVSEILNVLVSIDSTSLIESQSDYLGYDLKYIDTATMNFKVPEFIEVGDMISANRMYSPRECLPARPPSNTNFDIVYPREAYPKTGMPAVSEDTDHTVYEYEEPFEDENGKQIYKYVPATNSDGSNVYLCNENGDYLANIDITDVSQIYDLATIIQNGIPVSQLAKAPIVRDDYSAIQKDTTFTDLMNKLKFKTIKSVSFDNSSPRLLIEMPNDQFTLLMNHFVGTSANTYLYKWPASSLSRLYYEITSQTGYQINRNDLDFIQVRSYVEEKEGIFTEPGSLEARFGKFTYNGINYIMDLTTNTLLLKKYEVIENNYNVPYIFQAGIQVFTNKDYIKKGNTLLSHNETYPVTGVYLPTGGYGGFLNNTDWKERPDEIDFRAWNQYDFIKNSYDEYIYQCDYRGNKINIKHGLFFMETHESATMSYDYLTYEGINKFTVSEDLSSRLTTYNLYKIKPSEISIYSPKDQIWFNHNYTSVAPAKSENTLAIIKVLRDGFNINATTSDYKIEFLDYENKTPSLVEADGFTPIGISNYSFYLTVDSNNICSLKFKRNDSSNLPIILGNTLKLRITDKFGKVAEKIFIVQNVSEKEPCRIMSIKETFVTNGDFLGNSYTEVLFDPNSTITNGVNELLKTEDLSINPLEESLSNTNYNIVFTFKELLHSKNVRYGNRSFEFDIRELNLSLYVKQNWYDSTMGSDIKKYFQARIYSGTTVLNENNFRVTYGILNNDLVASVGSLTLYQPITSRYVEEGVKLELNNFSDYIFFEDSPEIVVTANQRVLIDGLYGKALLKVPTYSSFKELLDKLDNIIEYKNRRIINTYEGTEFNKITEISTNLSSVYLDKVINYEGFNTGDPKYLKIKVLPVKAVYPTLKYANSPDYIWEITQTETSEFGIDRIWINDKAYPLPPITIGKQVFNSENIPYYYTNNWVNKDNYSIYSSDEQGRFVKYIPAGSTIIPQVLGDEFGDTRMDIYGNIDPRVNLLEPIYKSSLDWFISEYYIKGQESNPFNTNVTLYETIKNKKFVQQIDITQKSKSENSIVDKVVTDSYISSVIQNVEYSPNPSAKSITQNYTKDYIDYVNGIINFTISQPIDKYRDNEYLFFYGINFLNQYYSISENSLLRNVWATYAEIDNTIKMKFDINSFEDYIDKKNKDVAIKWFTEMGVFDTAGKLIAYCHHPKVEYRTDSQHISYTLIIDEDKN